MIKKRVFTKGATLASALVVNLLILFLVPQFARQETAVSAPHSFDAVRLTQYRPDPQPEPRPQRRQAPPEPVPEKMDPPPAPTLSRPDPPRPPTPTPDIQVPDLRFEINPALKTAMAVAPPPKPKPKPKPRPKPKPAPQPAARKPAPEPEPAEPQPSPPARVAARKPAPAPASPAPARPVQSEFGLDEVDQPPRIVRKVEPDYPYRARRRSVHGEVTVKFLVTEKGDVDRLSVVKARPEGVFEKSVVRAVQRWRFSPGVHRGRPVATWVVLPIQFKLNG